jgi:hypothetical protein
MMVRVTRCMMVRVCVLHIVSHHHTYMRMYVIVSHHHTYMRMYVIVSHHHTYMRMYVIVSHHYTYMRMYINLNRDSEKAIRRILV